MFKTGVLFEKIIAKKIHKLEFKKILKLKLLILDFFSVKKIIFYLEFQNCRTELFGHEIRN